jgi:UDPglucose 6-dehydrogenase
MTHEKPIIAFAGMTHLGLNSAVAAAEKGFDTIGFDTHAALITQLKTYCTDINEPQLSELLQSNKNKLHFTSNISDLARADIIYISLDVPTDDHAVSDLTPVRSMIDKVNDAISKEALLVVLCQVPPGFTRGIKRDASKLYYQVETLIFGRAIERALYPERYIIGCADPTTAMDTRYCQFLKAYGCPILPMRYESAELAKTAINLFLAAQVCTANSLAELCEKIDADWNEIIPSLRLDKRIGQHAYIEPGLGLSGGNIERDLKTVSQLGYEMGAKISVPLSYIEHSKYRKQWSIQRFFEHYTGAKDFTVCVLGLAYKVNTHSIKNSPAIELLEALPHIHLRVYDPVVKNIPLDKPIEACASAYKAAENADMLFIMTPWDEFKSLDWKKILHNMRGKIIVDPYRIATDDTMHAYLHLVLGKAA